MPGKRWAWIRRGTHRPLARRLLLATVAMTDDNRPETATPSTTSDWKWVKMRMPAGGPGDRRSQSVLPSLRALPRREKLTITVRYRGGPEAWWELEARGRLWRRRGSLYLHDVLEEIYEGKGGMSRRG